MVLRLHSVWLAAKSSLQTSPPSSHSSLLLAILVCDILALTAASPNNLDVNVNPGESLRNALESLGHGQTLALQAGTYSVDTCGLVVDTDGITISGAKPSNGVTDFEGMSIIRCNPSGESSPSTVFNIRGKGVTIRNVRVEAAALPQQLAIQQMSTSTGVFSTFTEYLQQSVVKDSELWNAIRGSTSTIVVGPAATSFTIFGAAVSGGTGTVGGCIQVAAQGVNMQNVQFQNCRAQIGGAVALLAPNATIRNAFIQGPAASCAWQGCVAMGAGAFVLQPHGEVPPGSGVSMSDITIVSPTLTGASSTSAIFGAGVSVFNHTLPQLQSEKAGRSHSTDSFRVHVTLLRLNIMQPHMSFDSSGTFRVCGGGIAAVQGGTIEASSVVVQGGIVSAKRNLHDSQQFPEIVHIGGLLACSHGLGSFLHAESVSISNAVQELYGNNSNIIGFIAATNTGAMNVTGLSILDSHCLCTGVTCKTLGCGGSAVETTATARISNATLLRLRAVTSGVKSRNQGTSFCSFHSKLQLHNVIARDIEGVCSGRGCDTFGGLAACYGRQARQISMLTVTNFQVHNSSNLAYGSPSGEEIASNLPTANGGSFDIYYCNHVFIEGGRIQKTRNICNTAKCTAAGGAMSVLHTLNINVQNVQISDVFVALIPYSEFGSAYGGACALFHVQDAKFSGVNVTNAVVKSTQSNLVGGGGIYLAYVHRFAFFDSELVGCMCLSCSGGGMMASSSVSVTFSQVSVSQCRATVEQDTDIENDAGAVGGGIALFDVGVFDCADCAIQGCVSNNAGGGLFSNNATLSISRSKWVQNLANFTGGGLSMQASSVHIQSSLFAKNKATFQGGAISFPAVQEQTGSSFIMQGSKLVGNNAKTASTISVLSELQYLFLDDSNSVTAGDLPGDYRVEFVNVFPTKDLLINATLLCANKGEVLFRSSYSSFSLKSSPGAPVQFGSSLNIQSSALSQFVAECQRCPQGTYTLYQDSTEEQKQGVEVKCLPCPAHASCNGGNDIRPVFSFWGLTTQEPVQFYACLPGYCCLNETCPLGACAPGRTGPLCGQCQPGYGLRAFWSGCAPNSTCFWYPIILVLVALSVLVWSAFFISRPGVGRLGWFKVITFFYSATYIVTFGYSKDNGDISTAMLSIFQSVLAGSISGIDASHNGVCVWPGMSERGKLLFGFILCLSPIAVICLWAMVHIMIPRIPQSFTRYLPRIVRFARQKANVGDSGKLSNDSFPMKDLSTSTNGFHEPGKIEQEDASGSSTVSTNAPLGTSQVSVRKSRVGSAAIMDAVSSMLTSMWQDVNSMEAISVISLLDPVQKAACSLLVAIIMVFGGLLWVNLIFLQCRELGDKLVWYPDASHHCFGAWQAAPLVIASLLLLIPLGIILWGSSYKKRNDRSSLVRRIVQTRLVRGESSQAFIPPVVKQALNNSIADPSLMVDSSMIAAFGGGVTIGDAAFEIISAPFEEKSWFWQAFMLYRLVMLQLVRVFVPVNLWVALIQAALCVLYLAAHLSRRPFQKRILNVIEGLSLLLLSLVALLNVPQAFVITSDSRSIRKDSDSDGTSDLLRPLADAQLAFMLMPALLLLLVLCIFLVMRLSASLKGSRELPHHQAEYGASLGSMSGPRNTSMLGSGRLQTVVQKFLVWASADEQLHVNNTRHSSIQASTSQRSPALPSRNDINTESLLDDSAAGDVGKGYLELSADMNSRQSQDNLHAHARRDSFVNRYSRTLAASISSSDRMLRCK